MYQFTNEMLRQAQHDNDCYIFTLVYCYIEIFSCFSAKAIAASFTQEFSL